MDHAGFITKLYVILFAAQLATSRSFIRYIERPDWRGIPGNAPHVQSDQIEKNLDSENDVESKDDHVGESKADDLSNEIDTDDKKSKDFFVDDSWLVHFPNENESKITQQVITPQDSRENKICENCLPDDTKDDEKSGVLDKPRGALLAYREEISVDVVKEGIVIKDSKENETEIGIEIIGMDYRFTKAILPIRRRSIRSIGNGKCNCRKFKWARPIRMGPNKCKLQFRNGKSQIVDAPCGKVVRKGVGNFLKDYYGRRQNGNKGCSCGGNKPQKPAPKPKPEPEPEPEPESEEEESESEDSDEEEEGEPEGDDDGDEDESEDEGEEEGGDQEENPGEDEEGEGDEGSEEESEEEEEGESEEESEEDSDESDEDDDDDDEDDDDEGESEEKKRRKRNLSEGSDEAGNHKSDESSSED